MRGAFIPNLKDRVFPLVNRKNFMEIDQKMVDEKVVKIGKELEGLKMVDVLSILGVIVVELVHDAIGHGYDLRGLVSEWLKMLADNVSGINFDYVDEECGMLN